MFDEAEQQKLLDFYARVDAGVPKATCDFWMHWQPGSPQRCERVCYTVERDAEGRPDKAYGIGMNYTSQKLEQENYERSLRQYLTIDPDTLCVYQANLTENTCKTTYNAEGYAGELIATESVDELIEAASAKLTFKKEIDDFKARFSRAHLVECFAAGKAVVSESYRRTMANGKVRWASVRCNMMQNPQTHDIVTVISVVDVDDAVMQKSIFENITEEDYDYVGIIFPTDSTSRIYYFNPKIESAINPGLITGSIDYEQVCSYAVKTWVSAASAASFIDKSKLSNILEQLSATGHYAFEVDAKGEPGHANHKVLQYAYLNDDHERIIVMQRDITGIYREQQMRQAELAEQVLREQALRDEAERANQMKSEFLSNVSHDMRTPLNAVLGYTGIARRSYNMDEVQGYLKKIQRSGNVLQQLINDTLDLNKISTGITTLHPEPIAALDIYGDLNTAIMPAIHEKNIEFRTDFSESPMAVIDVDGVRIREVFLNLLNNAVKFTPEGGTITFTVKRLSAEGDIAHEVITVSDTGCGMSPEFISRAFEPFTQERTKDTADIEGSGLGLAIVKGIVEQMGGRVEAESELGRGSTFSVYLDFKLAPDVPLSTKKAAMPAEYYFTGRKMLLVEDNQMNTEIARTLLESRGMKVVCATNGQDGLDTFACSEVGEYDAVLMDVRMPVMGGLEATRRIRALDRLDARTVSIIAMTANAYEDDVRECLDAGMDAHVAKPINPQVLYNTIGACLEK